MSVELRDKISLPQESFWRWDKERRQFTPVFGVRTETEPRGIRDIIGFDLDGTLLDNMSEFKRIFGEELFVRYGIPGDLSSRHFDVSPIVLEKLESVFSDPRVKQAIETEVTDITMEEIARVIRSEWLKADAPPFEEVPGILSSLGINGFVMFVSSNSKEEEIERKLRHANIIQYFAAWVGRDSGSDPIQFLNKGEDHYKIIAERLHIPYGVLRKRLVVVGDSLDEISAAENSGVPVIIRWNAENERKSGIRAKEIRRRADWVPRDFTYLLTILKTVRTNPNPNP